ncbi:hypothetical protein NC651_035781 [Populus alba x Populus x berolinensis]|nr:hypothetical protein NC651_035781 [Populus alba x Populus x berolinensis]
MEYELQFHMLIGLSQQATKAGS